MYSARGSRITWVTSVLMACVIGCGDDGIKRYRMYGTITFKGKPVPDGTIVFDSPDAGIGGGFAPIKKGGEYDTEIDGRGHLGGSVKVQITGFHPPKNPGAWEDQIPLFEPYMVTIDLPTKKSEMDFEVPADQPMVKRIRERSPDRDAFMQE